MKLLRSMFGCRLMAWAIVLTFAGIIAGCHSGSQEAAAEPETPVIEDSDPGTILGALGGVRDGFILEFPEAMDTASVEASVAVVEGDFTDAAANVSKADFLKAAGASVGQLHFVWSGDNMKARVKWAAKYGKFYTLFLDNATSLTAEGVPSADSTTKYGGDTGSNPHNFDGDEGETADPALLAADGIARKNYAIAFTYAEFAELAKSFSGINLGGIDLASYWTYYNLDLEILDIWMAPVSLGRISGDAGATKAALIGIPFGGANPLVLFQYDAIDEEALPAVNAVAAMTIGEGADVGIFGPVGDMNRDGYADFMMEAIPNEDTWGVYIVAGSADFFAAHGEAPAIDSSLYAAAYEGPTQLGTMCSLGGSNWAKGPAYGDLDGDGFSDMALCLNYASGGAKGISPQLKADPPSSVMQLIHLYYGAEALSSDLFGGPTIMNDPVGSGITLGEIHAADVNGDAVADIIAQYRSTDAVTASVSKASYPYEFGLMIFFGAKDNRSAKTVADADVKISFGTAHALVSNVIGNVQSDCCDDIAAITTYLDDVNRDTITKVFGIEGMLAGDWEPNMDLSEQGVVGKESKGTMFTVVSGLGDVNNDGYDDVSISFEVTFMGTMMVIMGGSPDAGFDGLVMSASGADMGGFRMMGQIGGF